MAAADEFMSRWWSCGGPADQQPGTTHVACSRAAHRCQWRWQYICRRSTIHPTQTASRPGSRVPALGVWGPRRLRARSVSAVRVVCALAAGSGPSGGAGTVLRSVVSRVPRLPRAARPDSGLDCNVRRATASLARPGAGAMGCRCVQSPEPYRVQRAQRRGAAAYRATRTEHTGTTLHGRLTKSTHADFYTFVRPRTPQGV